MTSKASILSTVIAVSSSFNTVLKYYMEITNSVLLIKGDDMLYLITSSFELT